MRLQDREPAAAGEDATPVNESSGTAPLRTPSPVFHRLRDRHACPLRHCWGMWREDARSFNLVA